MSAQEQTVFQRTMEELHAWDGNGEPSAYPLYNGDSVVALLDKFPRFPGQVVIFPVQASPGSNASMFDLRTHVRLSVDLVAHTMGQRMQQVFWDKRIIRHDEGYAVPDHPHTILFPAKRSEGRKLYEASAFKPPDGYFSGMQEQLRLSDLQKRTLDSKIAVLALNATLLDPT